MRTRVTMSKVEVAEPLTLRDLLSTAIIGQVTIINECNEVLLATKNTALNVVPFYKVLNVELLDREIITYGAEDGEAIFKVKA